MADCDFNRAALHPAYPIKCRTSTQRTQAPESVGTPKSLSLLDPLENAIRVKIREEGFVRNKAVYIALGILADGTKEILGIWIEQTEGARFWLRVMNELKTSGVGDILICSSWHLI